MTKTEMAEELQVYLEDAEDTILSQEHPFGKDLSLSELNAARTLYNRHFKELFEDFKVKLQEQIEESIEDEEQEQDVEEAFGNGTMEGE